MHHVNPYTKQAGECNAETPQKCPWYGGENNPRHYTTAQEAENAAQELQQKTYGNGTITEYSFTKKFKELEKEHNETYDGLPTSFLKKDIYYDTKGNHYINPHLQETLAQQNIPQDIADYLTVNPPLELRKTPTTSAPNYANDNKNIHHLLTATSTPKDNQAPDHIITHNLQQLGFTNIQPLSETSTRKIKNATKAYTAHHNNQRFIITDANISATKIGNKYAFRYGAIPEFEQDGINDHHKTFQQIDIRKIAGATRIQKLTDENIINTLTNNHGTPTLNHPALTHPNLPIAHNSNTPQMQQTAWDYYNKKRTIGAIYRKLQEQQDNANAFQQQKRFITEQKTKIATAFTDKKNPDKTRQHMMETTPLNQHFKKVEIDNEVDPQEMQQFEQDYHNTLHKLPPIPTNKKPALRIRKLGKHKAIGLYSVNHNTIAIDVRDSSAFIHEYGHYLDLTVKNSQSTQQQFAPLRNQYKKAIWADNAIADKDKQYYTTPTEIHSRMFEIYAHEKLGINNKLINPHKLHDPEYQPLHEPKLKEQYFQYLDNTFKNNN